MADIDKEGIVNMLGNILGEDKKDAVDSLLNSLGTSSNDGDGDTDNSQLLNTAEVMTKMTRVMDKLNHTKNNKEFALLSAIRPYMRETRRSKVDTCMKMLQVVSVINEIKKEG